MSRSFKHIPSWRDRSKKWAKRVANKKVRRSNILDNGMFYKRISESWDIRDYSYGIYTRRQLSHGWYGEMPRKWKSFKELLQLNRENAKMLVK